MIIKELEPFRGTDKFQIAGRQAEEQMAFYLRRYFGDSEDVYIINDLRLGRDGESLQIDHLVVHQNGLIIIESKSVTKKITITKDFQWIRQYKDNSSGMKSPIIQAEMQKMLLESIMEELRTGYKCDIPSQNIESFVAISDNGIIEWSSHNPIEGVYKADQICNKIKAHLQNQTSKCYKKASEKDIETILKDIKDMKITKPEESDYLDEHWRLRGSYPQWMAEFLCECHVAHMNLRNNVVPKLLYEQLSDQAKKITDTFNELQKRIACEMHAYSAIWEKIIWREDKFKSLFLSASVAARRLQVLGNTKLEAPVRRLKK